LFNRATFVEDENTYWLLERSRPLYDPTLPQPPKPLPRYVSIFYINPLACWGQVHNMDFILIIIY
jgi:hypothetical protein